MKKIIALLLTVLILAGALSLCACRRKTTTSSAANESESKSSVVSFVSPQLSTGKDETPDSGFSSQTVPTPPPSSETPTPPPSSETPTPPPSSETPTPTPSSDPVIELSGSCSSDTGTQLNLFVTWKIETVSEGKYKVTVQVFLDSYSLYCSARKNCNSITIGDYDFVYSTDAIKYDDGTGRHRTELSTAEVTYTAETLPAQLEIGANWYFNGSYSGVQIGTLSASVTVDTGI